MQKALIYKSVVCHVSAVKFPKGQSSGILNSAHMISVFLLASIPRTVRLVHLCNYVALWNRLTHQCQPSTGHMARGASVGITTKTVIEIVDFKLQNQQPPPNIVENTIILEGWYWEVSCRKLFKPKLIRIWNKCHIIPRPIYLYERFIENWI